MRSRNEKSEGEARLIPETIAFNDADLSEYGKSSDRKEAQDFRQHILGRIRAKASRHAANNPLALFRKEVTADDVMNDQVIWPGVMTRLMACPPTCGGVDDWGAPSSRSSFE